LLSLEAERLDVQGKSQRAPLLMSAFVLALCSATGLLTGVITREVASAAGATRMPSLAQATSTPTTQPPTATTTSVPTSAPVNGNQFTVSIGVAGQPHPGQSIQVSASAASADTGAPVVGARCMLGPDTNGAPLLPTWPDAVMTDTTGKCAWAITLPEQTTAGAYHIRVDGYTAQYHAWSVTTVRVV
jgi:hypothetical protein